MSELTDEQIKCAWTGSSETNRPIIGVNKVLAFARDIERMARKNERERIAKHFDAAADAYAQKHGSVDPDTGTLEFGRGNHAEVKNDYYSDLIEHAEYIRAMVSNPDATIPA